ncbi:MAG: ABC transporter ATP-binding protein [Chloroflexi bacterium]|nr:ABC transporter ATP-binding protein [Chloroflexota bacterium]
MPVIELEGLHKRYGDQVALAGIDLVVRAGEIVCLLGPNGAGKTTTVEIAEGYRLADGGQARVFGLDPHRDRTQIAKRSGIMLQSTELHSQIRVSEAVQLFAAFYSRPLAVPALLERVGLERVADRSYRSLSGGERARLQLALALVGRPELLILDEPTAAMDAAARRDTWALLAGLRSQGAAVLLTTHLIDEAERLADRVAIVDRGRLVAAGTPTELRQTVNRGAAADKSDVSSRREVRLELSLPLDDARVAALRTLPGLSSVRFARPGVYILGTTSVGELLVSLATWLWAIGREPQSIQLTGASLEEVFLRLTGEEATDHGANQADSAAVEASIRTDEPPTE